MAMLEQYRLRCDDQQRILPGLDSAREEYEEVTVGSREARTVDRAVEHDELLAEQEVFSDELRFAASEVSEGPDHRAMSDRLGQA
ncbi:MAG: hypothetical protein M3R24_06170 [Chloroflexota bacterium]|nr:hypothetical protein [Chloroflexota bacterium]